MTGNRDAHYSFVSIIFYSLFCIVGIGTGIYYYDTWLRLSASRTSLTRKTLHTYKARIHGAKRI